MFSQACVKNSVRGGGVVSASVHAGQTPPGQTPPGQTPPLGRHPLDRHSPPGQTCSPGQTPCAEIDAAAVCCLQFSLLFALCKMSLFCTEINYSLMCSFNNKYLFKQINMVSFTQRNTSCTF